MSELAQLRDDTPDDEPHGAPRLLLPRLLLMDASIYLFRGHFSLPESWQDETGVATNGVLGFARALISGLQTHAPTHVGVAFDSSLADGFRKALYPAYKANRSPPDAAIARQMAHCQQLVLLLGLYGCDALRYEADDLIASLLTIWRAHYRTGRVWLMTRDKDFGQLLNDEHTRIWDGVDSVTLGRAEFIRKFRVDPESFPDYQALVGDAIDNIPGVPGVGASTAAQLLRRYLTLDELFAHLDEIRAGVSGVRRHARVVIDLQLARDRALLMRQLTRLRRDVSPVRTPAQLRPGPRDSDGLNTWLRATGLTHALQFPQFVHD